MVAALGAEDTIAVAVLETGRRPDWHAADAFVDRLPFAELESFLESPAPMAFRDPGGGLDAFKNDLRADLRRFRRAFECGDPELARFDVRNLGVYVTCEGEESDGLFGAMARLIWSGTLASAGFDDTRSAA